MIKHFLFYVHFKNYHVILYLNVLKLYIFVTTHSHLVQWYNDKSVKYCIKYCVCNLSIDLHKCVMFSACIFVQYFSHRDSVFS